MWLSKYFVYFAVYGVLGWIYETIYVTMRTGKWSNRGFLMGPIVPIYGVGGVSLTVVLDILEEYGSLHSQWWHVFLIGMFGSMVLEYSTSWLLEKLFHARWWDYRYMPFNINGRICLPYSLGFGIAALLVAYVIEPAVTDALEWVTPILYELFSLVFMSLISADATLTVSALTDFDENVTSIEENWNSRMTELVENMNEQRHAAGETLAEGREILLHGNPREMGNFLTEKAAAVEYRIAEGLSEGREKLSERKELVEEKLASVMAERSGRTETSDFITEKPEAAGSESPETLEQKKQQEHDRYSQQEHDRYSQQELEHSIGSMGHLRRAALSRVEIFSKKGIKKEQVDTALDKLKQKHSEAKAKAKEAKARAKEAKAKAKES